MKLAYTIKRFVRFCHTQITTVKPLNSGHLRVLKSLPAIERSPLLGGNFKEIVTFGTKCFVRYLGCPLLGGFTVIHYAVLYFLFLLRFIFLLLTELPL